MPRIWTQEEINAEMEAYAEAEALDAIADKGLRHHGPKPKLVPARCRKRQGRQAGKVNNNSPIKNRGR